MNFFAYIPSTYDPADRPSFGCSLFRQITPEWCVIIAEKLMSWKYHFVLFVLSTKNKLQSEKLSLCLKILQTLYKKSMSEIESALIWNKRCPNTWNLTLRLTSCGARSEVLSNCFLKLLVLTSVTKQENSQEIMHTNSTKRLLCIGWIFLKVSTN